MEDWDLQAVVRGRSNSEDVASMMNEQLPSTFGPSDFDLDDYLFGDLTKSLELKGEDHFDCLSQMPFSPQSFLATTNASSVSRPNYSEGKEESPELEMSPEDQPLSESSGSGVSSVSRSTNQVPSATKWKRSRKNDQKKVVQQVAAEGSSSDKWAWRKYGQKPIKGSPYPRSYYRCSSLKGCMARKQVERSISDPSIFIVTYTAEHSHAYPPRKNALAGSTRSTKFLTTKKKTIASDETKSPETTTSNEYPKTLSVASTFNVNEDKFLQPEASTDKKEEETMLVPDNMFFSDDDFYPSLGDFEGLFFD